MYSLKGTTTENNIFKNIEHFFKKLGSSMKIIINNTNNGEKNMKAKIYESRN